jgi:lysophospholipase L1-like esterase
MQILVFGASTTYGAWDREGGWIDRLKRYLHEKTIASDYEDEYLVYNLAIDGDTTDGVIKRLEAETKLRLWPGEDTIIMFSIGINDAMANSQTGELRIAPKRIEKNFIKLFDLAKQFTDKIIFVGYQPVDESKVDPIPWKKEYSYRNEQLKQVEQIAKQVFEARGGHFIETMSHFKNMPYNDYLCDGVHPNTEANNKIFEIIKNYLIEKEII